MSNARDKANIPALNFSSTGIDDNATSTAITIDSSQNVDVAGNIKFADNGRAVFGAGSDLQIWHTGSHSYIMDSGTGNLYLQGSSNIRFQNPNNITLMNIADGGDISFYEDTGTTPKMFWDASAESLELGTSSGMSPTATLVINEASDGTPAIEIVPTTDNINGVTANIRLWGSAYGVTNRHSEIKNITDGSTASNELAFNTNGTERMRITSTGNVGIGTTSPEGKFQSGNPPTSTGAVGTQAGFFVGAKSQFAGATALYQNQVCILDTNNTPSAGAGGALTFAGYQSTTSTTFFATIEGVKENSTVNDYGGSLKFYTRTNGVANMGERMRIDSNGKIYIGRTNDPYMSALSSKNLILDGGSNGADLCITSFKNASTVMYHMGFYNSNSFVGSISTVGSGTAYNTASDYRLKENVNYDFDATTRLKQLKPARFNFIADADTTVDGFLAHEVSSVVPEAITGTKDAVQVWEEGDELPEGVSVGDNKLDENGNTIPVYQGIDQAKLVPLLVKTIQELEARITALETNQP